jgi:hypothetical protein
MGGSMIKRLYLAFALLAGLIAPAYPAGTISFSLSQQLDTAGNPLNGGKLYFFQAGTTTPQSAYADSALTIALANPITLDSAGRVPQFFLADGTIKIRLTNAAGVTQVAADGVMVIGASSGSGSGSVVDATTVLAVGDLKARYGTGALSGFVRANGGTIGSATSGATERANSDCQELFEYLWTEDANLTVSTGRGATAAADWAANKTIALPDWRGRVLAGLDGMGSSAAGRIATNFGSNADVLGTAAGAETRTLLTANLPPYTPAGTNTGGAASFTYSINSMTSGAAQAVNNITASGLGTSVSTTFTQPTFTGTAQGGTSTPFAIMPHTMLATIYLKL